MRLAMTLMVRDEADIIEAMIEHHLQQGVDIIIATDNGSVDGTTEILERYAAAGTVDLRHHPVHDKRQAEMVTQMARDAKTLHDADWVLNADADEFWVPNNRSLTLKEAFENIPTDLHSFTVPVIDMIGAPAAEGSGLDRLIYRDSRPVEELNRVGLLAHSTHDAAHIGDPEVNVAQGNHYVSLASHGEPDPAYMIEVLHLPWRSWKQYEHKVRNAGSAYEVSGLTPSPNHHGMRDYRRLLGGTLLSYYLVRHPSAEEFEAGLADGRFMLDRTVSDEHLTGQPDVFFSDDVTALGQATGRALIAEAARIAELEDELARAASDADALRAEAAEIEAELSARLEREKKAADEHIRSLEAQVQAFHDRKIVKAADWAGARAREAQREAKKLPGTLKNLRRR
ncbi:glycosyltransferase family 2 protein [Leifsonia sp. ALI-44-B]|uniref:glycosyltransferase family 2 protein n=1 Tax=Leifsonia sp. ALI-44-B TaxID=1933776 RepID=UPI001EE6A913|nr:glycosyltransferase family 2 protein [Leifsonia sp. ALI-44-B]